MRFVLDNSIVMRWLLSDLAVPAQNYARAVLKLFADGNTAVVPNLRTLKAGNAQISRVGLNALRCLDEVQR